VLLGWYWYASLLPGSYSVMSMGTPDYGGGPSGAGHHSVHAVQVTDLAGPADGTPDVGVSLVARRQQFRLASGEQVEGYTLNGGSPGPTITAAQGDLVQVTLRNDDVADGVTLHWHGLDVPNAEDGVAGVTQDAVPPGGTHVYRFLAQDPGTYWYHSHQAADPQVKGGLWGPLVITPTDPPGTATAAAASAETVAAVHSYQGLRTVTGRTGVRRLEVRPGSTARIRVINTDNGPLRTWTTGTGYRVLAIDGHDLVGPTEVRDRVLVVPAGGRADLQLAAPGGGAAVLIGPPTGDRRPSAEPTRDLDLLGYGRPTDLGFDPERPDRRFRYDIGRRIGLLDGRPGYWWTVNGHRFPDVPMFMVSTGDVVRMTIRNHSGQVHPMHLHGHHAVVLSVDGRPATGSPWWVDSLEVADDTEVEIGLVADNPGIWMDHCHNLEHAENGLVAHLAYDGVREPFTVGQRSGKPDNAPE
jgi:FtsP/CotA-like multicopper oxidase with cupredoxin domain